MDERSAFEERKEDAWIVDYEHLGIKMHCLLNTDEDKIKQNIEENMKKGHEQIWPCKEQETVCVICAGGPTLNEHIEEIKELQKQGGKVIALANVAHILIENDIRPNAHVLLDAKPRNSEFILEGVETTFFIASQCDPSVFEAAERTGNKIYLWHGVNNDKEFEVIHEKGEPWVPVQSGSTITMRAIRLFSILGYKNMHLFGFDSCYKDGSHHGYEQPDADKHKVVNLEFEGRNFTLSPWMLSQFMEFTNFVRAFGMNLNLEVHGDGLISHLIKSGAKKEV